MPTYDYDCAACGNTHEQFHSMNEKPERCPHCGSKKITKAICLVAIKRPVDMFWENENGGRGRYISQLQKEQGKFGSDPDAFCTSQDAAMEKAKRRGLNPVKAR